MEMDDDAFQADASAIAMSLDELAEASPPDQLYEDLTGERPKSSPFDNSTMHDNQRDGDNDQGDPSQPCAKKEDPSHDCGAAATSTAATTQSSPSRTEEQPTPSPAVMTRKSPRRNTGNASKASNPTATKKSTTGTKRASQHQSQSFSWNDILQVQNLIERCLQQLLSKNDIVLTLHAQAKVDPAFTAIVWQKLEEQNPAFFRAYALQLQLKEQIATFNFLVSQQKEMMAKASGNAAFLSFLASSDARKNQRQAMTRGSRMASLPQARGRSHVSMPAANTTTSMEMSPSSSATYGIPFPLASPLPLPSPMKTDLDTHAFFS